MEESIICANCGKEIEDSTFCPYCGTSQDSASDGTQTLRCPNCDQLIEDTVFCPFCGTARKQAPAALSAANEHSETTPQEKPKSALRKVLAVNLAVFSCLAILVVYAFETAVHWEKVDIPEHPETFHEETVETGEYIVTMDSENPCYVNQPWSDCINAMINEYNNACADRPLSSRMLTGDYSEPSDSTPVIIPYPSSTDLCQRYNDTIEQMKAEDQGYGWYVVSLGSWGHLHAEPEYETVQVSNNDYRPAVTHEATCYLGFIGECDMPEEE